MHQKNIMAWKKAIKNSKWLIQTIYNMVDIIKEILISLKEFTNINYKR